MRGVQKGAKYTCAEARRKFAFQDRAKFLVEYWDAISKKPPGLRTPIGSFTCSRNTGALACEQGSPEPCISLHFPAASGCMEATAWMHPETQVLSRPATPWSEPRF